MSETRKPYFHAASIAVIKLGTQLLSDSQGQLDSAFIETIADQVVALRQRGIRTAVVSSGAIGAGLRELNLAKRPTDLAKLQAVAAVGQRRLMDVWAVAFSRHGIPVAQVLLTREDVDDRTRFLNLRNTIGAIHEFGAIPIINENDTISTDELVKISFGDNDLLAALVAHALRADLLVLLSVVDGILDAEGKSVRLVDRVDAARELVRAEKSALGKGGFNSKLEAARQVTEFGEVMIVANGRMENILPRLIDGEELGTLFAPVGKKASSRSRWIGSARPAGIIVVDDGAARALVEKNKSLLPAGIVSVEGDFQRGDVVAIQSSAGQTIARGLSNYAAEDVKRIRGKKTSEVRAALADGAYDEVVHRDNLVVM
ncbi:MAG TPA: glutamate 5-kinase [Tepidisphaeraceae bacterium]|jgi:glutamate 5-kinase|nr:glutamate 5-kinase [Tepidisphaeraceae bacterium]